MGVKRLWVAASIGSAPVCHLTCGRNIKPFRFFSAVSVNVKVLLDFGRIGSCGQYDLNLNSNNLSPGAVPTKKANFTKVCHFKRK